MRLIDTVFRQGHLSERALVDAIVSGDRPQHLDRCDICAERAVQLARWMDDLQTDAVQMADEIFTPERLNAQQDQILRRLEQLDHPARVIAFPAASRPERQGTGGRRVALSWVGVAAAAGLAIGVVGGQVTARLSQPVAPATTTAATVADSATPVLPVSAETPDGPVDSTWLGESFEVINIPSLGTLDRATPRLQQVSARSGG